MPDPVQYRIAARNASELVAELERAVAAGELAPGSPLPSVRRLAADLGLSPSTVAAALKDLRARGLVVTRERSRSYVSWQPPVGSSWARPYVPDGARDLAGGNPDPALLPDLAAALRRVDAAPRLYGGEPVDEELNRLGLEDFAAAGIRSDRVAVVSGALDGVERVLGAWLRPGDRLAVEDPGYAGVFDLARALGLALLPVSTDERGMLPDALRDALDEGAAAVVITPRGLNPTGAALDRARARELRAVLDGVPEALVIEDDHLGPVAGVGRETVLGGARARARWAAVRSVAKSLGPDLRVGLLAGDAETLDRVEGRQLLGPHWVSHLLQQTVVALWRDRTVATRIARAERAYADRREALVRALAGHRLEVAAPSGFNVWIPVREEASTVAALLDRGWAVAPGEPYRLRAGPAIRVTCSALPPADARAFAADLAAVLRPARRTRAA